MSEKYNIIEKAQGEAEGLQKKVGSGEDSSYSEAGQQELGKQKKAITPEMIFSDQELLRQVAEFADWRQRGREAAERGEKIPDNLEPEKFISAKLGFGMVDKTLLIFYCAQMLGLSYRLQDDDRQIDKYFQELIHDPEGAKQFLRSAHNKLSTSQREALSYLAAGVDLSNIIPGAPKCVVKQTDRTGFNVYRKNVFGAMVQKNVSIDAMDTEKAHDLLETGKNRSLTSVFEGKTVVDLGAGTYAEGFRVAEKFKATNYVAVEPFNYRRCYEQLERLVGADPNSNKHLNKPTMRRVHVAPVDMLAFLKNMPSGIENVVFLVSGVDSGILGLNDHFRDKDKDVEEAYRKRREYAEQVERELHRVMSSTSSIVSYASSILFSRETYSIDSSINAHEGAVSVIRLKPLLGDKQGVSPK